MCFGGSGGGGGGGNSDNSDYDDDDNDGDNWILIYYHAGLTAYWPITEQHKIYIYIYIYIQQNCMKRHI